MTTRTLIHPIILFLILCMVFTCCNGQNPKGKPERNPDVTAETSKQTKIVRTKRSKGENVGCQLLDKDGNLWFSIVGEGVYRYDGTAFTNFTTRDGLCNNDVQSIIQDRAGNILLGSKKGICRYDGTTFSKYPVPDSLAITCMLEDKDGNLWFGTIAGGIYRYNGTTLENFLNNKPFNLGNTNQLILDILQDNRGDLWFSSWNGGGVWRYNGKEFTNFLPSADYYKANQDKRNSSHAKSPFGNFQGTSYAQSQDHITDDMIFSMIEDNSGNIWFATRDHGICRFDGKTFTSFGKKEGFDSRGATAILQDEKNGFWITTADSGVWYYNGRTFKHFTERDGLVNNAVMNLLKDKNGNLWFGTKWFGLSRYDGKSFTTFSQNGN